MAAPYVTLAAGYKAKVAYIDETSYGVAPGSAIYLWPGAVTQCDPVIDRKTITIYRLDGVARFPAWQLPGAREVGLDVTYYPQDVNILNDVVNSYNLTPTNVNSHTWAIEWTDIAQSATVLGCRANKVTFTGETGKSLEIKVSYWAENISWSLPTNTIGFPGDTGSIPFYFAQHQIAVNGVQAYRPLKFSLDVTNEEKRVFAFGQETVRSIPALNASLKGTLNMTFENANDLNSMISTVTSFSDNYVTIFFAPNSGGGNYGIAMAGVAFTDFKVPNSPTDLIAFDLNFAAENVVILTNATSLTATNYVTAPQ